MRQTLQPMTPQERLLATQNHYLVEAFLRKQGLPFDEYYDVVIFRYLLSVENWFRRPELYIYEFSTIAFAAMRSALGHEREKQRRRIQTISLDEPIPGTDGLTLADIVTEENLDFIPYTKEAI